MGGTEGGAGGTVVSPYAPPSHFFTSSYGLNLDIIEILNEQTNTLLFESTNVIKQQFVVVYPL